MFNGNVNSNNEMRTETINGIVLELYEDIDELPIINYNAYNEYSLLDHEIGSSITDITKRFEKLDTFLAKGKLSEAIQERKNLQFLFNNIYTGVDYPSMQFACFIHSINGERFTDLRVERIEALIKELSDQAVSIGFVKKVLNNIKKKFTLN